MGRCRLAVLGGFDFSAADRTITLATRKDRLLLAYLAVNAGKPQPREKLASLLWADRADPQARASLRQSLAVIKTALDGAGCSGALQSTRASVTLDPAAIDIDLTSFEAIGTADLGLFTGELLAGVDPATPDYAAWLAAERSRILQLATRKLQDAAELRLEHDLDEAIAFGRRLVALDPLNEHACRSLMRLLALDGDRTGAAKLFAACRDALQGELGVGPARETERVYRDILAGSGPGPSAPAGTDERPRLAVLPFANPGNDPTLAILCEGLAEDITTGLGRFKLLFVIDRNSSRVVAQQSADSAEIGKLLSVGLLVQGSLRRHGETVRIAVQLVRPQAREQVWGETFDAAVADVLNLPDRIARAITAALHARVEQSIVDDSRRKPKLAAYELTLRGIRHLRGYEPGDNEKAIELFEAAMRADPDYALARAYRGFADVVLHGYDSTPRDILNRARAMIESAIAMDAEEPRNYWLLGIILGYTGDFHAEERQYLKVLAINPCDANAMACLASTAAALGRHEEAIERYREAIRFNPYHPEWYWIDFGSVLYVAGRYEEAIEAYHHRSRPGVWVLARLAACYAQLDRMEEARQAVEQLLRQDPEFRLSQRRFGSWGPSDSQLFRDGMKKAGLRD